MGWVMLLPISYIDVTTIDCTNNGCPANQDCSPTTHKCQCPGGPNDLSCKQPWFVDKSGVLLRDNIFQYWGALFAQVLGSSGPDGHLRVDHLDFLTMQGDFDPSHDLHMAWFNQLWPAFMAWWSWIPTEIRTIEIEGDNSSSDPVSNGVNRINTLRSNILAHGWPEPSRYDVEAYANWAVVQQNPGAFYNNMFRQFANACGGFNRMRVEEFGTPYADDGAGGTVAYSSAFNNIAQLDPTVPFGIWEYQSADSGDFGIYRWFGTTPREGAGVLPYYFSAP